MFYLEIFYLPCLKNLVAKSESNNDVCMHAVYTNGILSCLCTIAIEACK